MEAREIEERVFHEGQWWVPKYFQGQFIGYEEEPSKDSIILRFKRCQNTKNSEE